jgi:ArsR family transcriptional regulator
MEKRNRIKQNPKTHNCISLPEEVSEAITEVGGLEQLSCSIPEPEEIASEAAFHRALSNRTRLEILWAIKCCDMCPCVLKEFLKVQDSKLSYHLSVLEQTGLVESYRKKNWKIYTITELGRSTLNLQSRREPTSPSH